jgi:superfamily I DNA and/or RNA helicase
MRPEISALVRHLTYPKLVDHPKTADRPDIRGLTNNVIFVNHNEPEDDLDELKQSSRFTNETGCKASKRNKFEVTMVLKVLRYLKQQNYASEKIVILTPYLGQLRALQLALKDDNDPVLNEMDSTDLIRAGLDSSNAGKQTKESIRLATIGKIMYVFGDTSLIISLLDNYQGEESDIVIISLTRSNPEGKIGFMAALERVNVLLSRARDGLILIGNANTFMKARHGGDTWTKLLELLAQGNHIYDGLPVKCQQHPKRTAVLKVPGDFDSLCPDGGCSEPW